METPTKSQPKLIKCCEVLQLFAGYFTANKLTHQEKVWYGGFVITSVTNLANNNQLCVECTIYYCALNELAEK